MRRIAICSVALSLLVSACSLGPRGDWKEAIVDAPDAAAKAGIAVVRMTTSIKVIETNIRIEPKPVYPVLIGRADFGREVSLLTAPKLKGNLGVAFDHLTAYFKRSTTSVGTSGKHWARFDFTREPSVDIDTNDTRDAIGAPTISPTLAVDLLAGILTGSIENEGSADVGGVATTHYKGRLSQDAAVRDLRDEDRQEAIVRLFETMGMQDDIFPVEVWLDGEGRPRALRFTPEQHKDRVNLFRTTYEWRFSYGVAGEPVVLPSAADTVTSRRFTEFFGEAVRSAS
jgi:hypothetical protein